MAPLSVASSSPALPRSPGRGRVVALVALLALSATPGPWTEDARAGAAHPFGTFVERLHGDALPTLVTYVVDVCYIDVNGNAAYTAGEPVYLAGDPCPGTVGANHIRLTAAGGLPAGTLVRASDADFGTALAGPLSETTASFDADGNAAWSFGDALYLDLTSPGTVSVGDVRLTPVGPKAAGTTVLAADPDLSLFLVASPFPSGTIGFWDGNGDAVLGPGDLAYLDANGGTVTVGAVRLVTGDLGAYGSVVTHLDVDQDPLLTFVDGAVCFLDDDGDTVRDFADDPLYFIPGGSICFSVTAGSVRLSPFGSHGAGSAVSAADADFGSSVVQVPNPPFQWTDLDASGGFSADDALYVDADASGDVTVGDAHVTALGGHAAGSPVAPGHLDIGTLFTGFGFDSFQVKVHDLNGNAAYEKGEPLVLDDDSDGAVDVGEVRLYHPSSYAYGSRVAAGDADARARLMLLPVPPPLCFGDLDTNGVPGPAEPFYLHVSGSTCGSVSVRDVRFTDSTAGGAGSKVASGDGDVGSALTLPSTVTRAYHDVDGTGAWTPGDAFYLDVDNSGTVSPGDRRGSGALAGSSVGSGNPDVGTALVAYPSGHSLAFWDLDRRGGFGGDDVLFVTPGPFTGFVTLRDLRWTDTVGLAAPSPPLGLAATASPGTLALAWNPPASDGGELLGYRVYRGPSAASLALHDTVAAATTSYADAGLGSGATFAYAVTAFNSAGESASSNVVTATTPSPPGAPENVDVGPGPVPGSLKVTWDPPASDGGSPVTFYLVYEQPFEGDPFIVGNTSGEATSFLHEGLGDGEPHCYRVRAGNAVDSGPLSTEACASTAIQPASAPLGMVARAGPGLGVVTLTWAPPASDGGSPPFEYALYRAVGDGAFDLADVVSAQVTDYEDAGLDDDTRYRYRVAAVNEAGEGAPSNVGEATTHNPEPEPEPEDLPEGLASSSAAWQGHYAYVFGGLRDNGTALESTEDIVRFDPDTGQTTTLGVHLPGARHGASAVWGVDGTLASSCHPACAAGFGYLFGGARVGSVVAADLTDSCHPACAVGLQIVEFDAEANETRLMNSTLPDEVEGTSAAWAPAVALSALPDSCHPACRAAGVAYIFGGNSPLSSSSLTDSCHPACAVGVRIFEFAPATDTLVQRDAVLPSERTYTSAVWSGSHAYVFGGRGPGGFLDEIVRYDPATDTVTTMAATLPTPRAGTSAVWDGSFAYVIGGRDDGGALAEIVRYDPATDTVVVAGQLPENRSETSAVFDGRTTYVFGGQEDDGPTDDVASFTPTAPQDVQAERRSASDPASPPPSFTSSQGGQGRIRVAWSAPLSSGASPLTGYRVYRGLGPATETLVAELDATKTFYLDQGLAPGTTYHYRVSALNGAGEGPQSQPASATTTTRPTAPRDLSATPAGVGNVGLAWQPPLDDGGEPLRHYRIFRATSGAGSGLAFVGQVDASQRTFHDFGCRLGQVCTYFVNATNVHGAGPASNGAITLGTRIAP